MIHHVIYHVIHHVTHHVMSHFPSGAVTVYPTILRLERKSPTSIRVLWRMPAEFSDLVNEWYVEYRLEQDGENYVTEQVERPGA